MKIKAPFLSPSFELPYHVTAKSHHPDCFFLPTSEVWKVFCAVWNTVIKKYKIKLHAFVLMSNHFHALVSAPHSNLNFAMLFFIQEASREINKRTERVHPVFQGPYKGARIESRFYYENALIYVYQNPVSAGLCKQVQEYPYSTLRFQHLLTQPLIPLADSLFERRGVMDPPLWQNLSLLNKLHIKPEVILSKFYCYHNLS